MMREILFRGKSERSGEWVYGSLIVTHGGCVIYSKYHPLVTADSEKKGDYLNQYVVDPQTVGQYTGLTDTNGKKIFEGDIVHYVYDGGKENGWKADQNSIIKWDFSGFYMDGIFGSNKYACRSGWLENIACNGGKFFKVIGNIHDNPELLEARE